MKNSFATLVFLLLFCSWGKAEPPQLSSTPDSFQLLPIDTIITDSFMDNQGKFIELPTQERYLLWVIETSFAFDDREKVPIAEIDPRSEGSNIEVDNPLITTLPFFNDLTNYVIFYSHYSDLPLLEERSQLSDQLTPFQTLFDDNVSLTYKYSDPDGFLWETSIDSLLFMEGQTIRYKYPSVWSDPLYTPLITNAAQTFLAGQEPLISPLTIPGGTLNIASSGQPSLAIRVPDSILEAPPNSAEIKITTKPDGSSVTETIYQHPASGARFVLEALPPLLDQYNVQGIAVISGDATQRIALEQAFPSWQFIFLENPEDNLMWSSVGSTILTDANGIIQQAFFISPDLEADIKFLQQALSKVSTQ